MQRVITYENLSYVIGFRFIINGFKNFHLTALVWFVLIVSVCLLFKCYNIWAEARLKLKGNKYISNDISNLSFFVADQYWKKRWDCLWISILATYYITVLYLISKCVWWLDLPLIMAATLETETVRKTYLYLKKIMRLFTGKTAHESTQFCKKQFTRCITLL